MNFIDGQWQTAQGAHFESLDPYYQRVLWQGHAATEIEVVQAVKAARTASAKWQQQSVAERAEVIQTFAQLVEQDKSALAKLIASETGKPLWEADTEVSAVIAKVAISIQAYHERTGEKQQVQGEQIQRLQHKALGILAILGPFNFPAHLPNGHIIPALLAGNACIFKPSPHTPAVAEFIVRLWQRAGLPNGVLNLLQGQTETARLLLAQPELDGVLFTGSDEVGQQIQAQQLQHPHRLLALEMGGNNALIVWDVADVSAAALMTVQSAFITAGQRCTCARRLIVPQGARGDTFLTALKARTQRIQVGPWDGDPQPFMGTMIHAQAAKTVMQRQQQLLAQGATVIYAGEHSATHGALLKPIIMDVTDCTAVSDQETFGPLLLVQRVPEDFSAAITAANQTDYGLAVGLFSDTRAYFDRLLRQSHAGIVNWNQPLTGASSALPFGGVKQSGNYRPSAYYAADYCAYPVASLISERVAEPSTLPPGIK